MCIIELKNRRKGKDMEKRYSKILTVVLILIIVLVIGLLAFLGYNFYKNKKINSDANNFADKFGNTIATEKPTDGNSDSQNNTAENITSSGDASNSQGVITKYKGFNVIGIIEIPKTNLKYPVLSDYSAKSLNTSVVAIYPQNPTLNVVGNVVIAGHNYKNGNFFSNNKKLSNGDKIIITDLNNNKVTYTIYNMFETTPNDTESYNKDTDGKMEITLSTCTDDSSARLIIEARAE